MTPMMTCMYNDLGKTLSMPPPVFFFMFAEKGAVCVSRLRLRDGSGHGGDGLRQRVWVLFGFRSCDDAPDLLTLQRTADHVTRLALIEVSERDVLSAAVVPNDEVADRPTMPIDEFRRGCVLIEERQQRFALGIAESDELADALADQ